MKRLFIFAVFFLLIFLTACSNKSTNENNENISVKGNQKENVGFTVEDVQKAVNEGHIVIEQTSDDKNSFYNHDPNAIKVYNLEKIFAFEDNVDAKGEKGEVKITTFQKGLPIQTDTLSFDGEFINFNSGISHHNYKCKLIYTTYGSATLDKCTDENGKTAPSFSVVTDNEQHFKSVKEDYKEKLKKTTSK